METDQLMRINPDRFKEFSGVEGRDIALDHPETLKRLEEVPALLMYERGTDGPNADRMRYGCLRDVQVLSGELVFRFSEGGFFNRAVVEEFASRLGLKEFEHWRTHWLLKMAVSQCRCATGCKPP